MSQITEETLLNANSTDFLRIIPLDDFDATMKQSLEEHINAIAGLPAEDEIISDSPTDEDTASESIVGNGMAGVKRIIKFAIPAAAVWLCGPVLSLIDTASVGIFAGTAHQAALSPAVFVVDYMVLFLAFLYAATTNIVAAAAVPGADTEEGATKPARALLSSLQISLRVGSAMGMFVQAFAPQLLRLLMGPSPSPEIFEPALSYVRIRALGIPAAAVLGSAQSACVGLKDLKGPLLVLGAAALVNGACDALLVPTPWKWVGGAAGAAWATVLSQYVALAFFLSWLKGPLPIIDALPKIFQKIRNRFSSMLSKKKDSESFSFEDTIRTRINLRMNKSSRRLAALFHHEPTGLKSHAAAEAVPPASDKDFTTRGFLKNQGFRRRHVLRNPSREQWKSVLPYVVPVTTTTVGRVSMFLSMAHVVSSTMGAVTMAGQQIAMSLFDSLCPVSDALSLSAQSFVPTEAERQKRAKGGDGLREMTGQFIVAGAIFSALVVAVVGCIPHVSGLFTNDPAVVSVVHDVVPYLVAWFAMQGTVMATEGVILGRRDLTFMSVAYAFYTVGTTAIFWRLKMAALHGGKAIGLKHLWQVLVGYEFSRLLLWGGRCLWLSRKPIMPKEEV